MHDDSCPSTETNCGSGFPDLRLDHPSTSTRSLWMESVYLYRSMQNLCQGRFPPRSPIVFPRISKAMTTASTRTTRGRRCAGLVTGMVWCLLLVSLSSPRFFLVQGWTSPMIQSNNQHGMFRHLVVVAPQYSPQPKVPSPSLHNRNSSPLVLQQSSNPSDNKDDDDSAAMERAWRHAKKPLLSIGSKGATLTHGNSLKELLEQHTVVKVKVNTVTFDNSLQKAFEVLCELTGANGGPSDMECLQARSSSNILLVAQPGTRQRILQGDFPPPPPPPPPPTA